MKKYVLLIGISMLLIGCSANNSEKDEYHLKGIVIEVANNGESILVEDEEIGLVWVSLTEVPHTKDVVENDTVMIWTTGAIRESYPGQADGVKMEVVEK